MKSKASTNFTSPGSKGMSQEGQPLSEVEKAELTYRMIEALKKSEAKKKMGTKDPILIYNNKEIKLEDFLRECQHHYKNCNDFVRQLESQT
mmetsp:Transcript_17713/g.12637  ORF Transcript_17713/g.12637 Transcript_17713/m.12637 type:complete len:91 (+) Transcript_17713:286-558(+)|eukprot:CAMPEP_0202962250 /NCGR_PEP_ID=MMETSP1396-20130829/6350_1 /ASSEMBLY_ACC=CAM_ASM_000872 /TAXON_ID= /ORGANISM="Pseudokeronopsis sp., Strain Brazil" /LENGTH=90 /DNA_ID=CAMNT_0049682693 /DNA_START=994 /DNA_END=1266 /DNA_ORIENTATION=-